MRRGRHTHGEPRPRHRPATTAAPPVNPMLHHLRRVGRRKVEQPARNRCARRCRTRQGRPTPPAAHRDMMILHHDPGGPHAVASPPCGPPDPPACAPFSPASSASDAGPPASQARHSRAACRCCGYSTRDGAPTSLSARQDAPLTPEAPRSLPPGVQPAPPNSPIPTPTKALATIRYCSCAGSLMPQTHCQPTDNRKHPGQSQSLFLCNQTRQRQKNRIPDNDTESMRSRSTTSGRPLSGRSG